MIFGLNGFSVLNEFWFEWVQCGVFLVGDMVMIYSGG